MKKVRQAQAKIKTTASSPKKGKMRNKKTNTGGIYRLKN